MLPQPEATAQGHGVKGLFANPVLFPYGAPHLKSTRRTPEHFDAEAPGDDKRFAPYISLSAPSGAEKQGEADKR